MIFFSWIVLFFCFCFCLFFVFWFLSLVLSCKKKLKKNKMKDEIFDVIDVNCIDETIEQKITNCIDFIEDINLSNFPSSSSSSKEEEYKDFIPLLTINDSHFSNSVKKNEEILQFNDKAHNFIILKNKSIRIMLECKNKDTTAVM